MSDTGAQHQGTVGYPAEPAGRAPTEGSNWPLYLLVTVNLLPVVGVVLGELTLADVFLVYWFENVIVGVTTLVRILTARHVASPGTSSMRVRVGVSSQKLAEMEPGSARSTLAVFFCIHYGMFTLGHGIFTGELIDRADGFADLTPGPILAGVAALAVSHAFSLWWNWFRGGERESNAAERMMIAPYPRIFVMHIAVLLGFAVLSGTEGAGNAVGPVIVLCALKTVLDAALHARQHRRLRAR